MAGYFSSLFRALHKTRNRKHRKPTVGDMHYYSLTGRKATKEYDAWHGMKQRCLNPNDKNYHNYGGRGITVCKEWIASFDVFLADMGKAPSADHSIERINNNRGYNAQNCKWATAREQGKNKRNSNLIEYQNQVYNIVELARLSSIPRNVLWNRIMIYKWPIEKALQTPVKSAKRRSLIDRILK